MNNFCFAERRSCTYSYLSIVLQNRTHFVVTKIKTPKASVLYVLFLHYDECCMKKSKIKSLVVNLYVKGMAGTVLLSSELSGGIGTNNLLVVRHS